MEDYPLCSGAKCDGCDDPWCPSKDEEERRDNIMEQMVCAIRVRAPEQIAYWRKHLWKSLQ